MGAARGDQRRKKICQADTFFETNGSLALDYLKKAKKLYLDEDTGEESSAQESEDEEDEGEDNSEDSNEDGESSSEAKEDTDKEEGEPSKEGEAANEDEASKGEGDASE